MKQLKIMLKIIAIIPVLVEGIKAIIEQIEGKENNKAVDLSGVHTFGYEQRSEKRGRAGDSSPAGRSEKP